MLNRGENTLCYDLLKNWNLKLDPGPCILYCGIHPIQKLTLKMLGLYKHKSDKIMFDTREPLSLKHKWSVISTEVCLFPDCI